MLLGTPMQILSRNRYTAAIEVWDQRKRMDGVDRALSENGELLHLTKDDCDGQGEESSNANKTCDENP